MKEGKWYNYMYTNMEVDSLSTVNGTYFAKFLHTGGNSATYPLKARVLTEDAFDGKTYDIEVNQGFPDTFRWSDDGGSTWKYKAASGTTYTAIETARWFMLAPGLEIKFPVTNGYDGAESFSLINTPVSQESPFYRNPIKTYYEKGAWCALEHPQIPTHSSGGLEYTDKFPIKIDNDFTMVLNPDNHIVQSVIGAGKNMGVDVSYLFSTEDTDNTNYQVRFKAWDDINLSDETTDVTQTLALDVQGTSLETATGKGAFTKLRVNFVAGAGTEVIAAPSANKFKVGLFLYN